MIEMLRILGTVAETDIQYKVERYIGFYSIYLLYIRLFIAIRDYKI